MSQKREGNNVWLVWPDHPCNHAIRVKLKRTTNRVYQTAYPPVWRPVYRRAVLHEPVRSTPADPFAAIRRQKNVDPSSRIEPGSASL